PGRVDRAQPQPAHPDHRLVLEDLVVGRQHVGVLGGDVDLVAGVAQLGHGLDVVPVPVGLEHRPHAEAAAEVEQPVVLVGRVEQDGLARLRAPQDVDGVVQRPHDDLVDLVAVTRAEQRAAHAASPPRGGVGRHRRQRAPRGRMEPTSPREGTIPMAVTAQPEPRPAPAGRPWLAGLDRRGVLVGGGLVVLLLVLVYVGSEGLRWFDAALAGYLVGTLLAVFGTAYRYVVWVERPPTRALRARGWQAFWGSGRRLRNLARLPDVLWTRLVGQGFIRSRSLSRW